MDNPYAFFTQEMKRRKLKITHHRLRILEYLHQHRTHPTAEQIYQDLHRDVPVLSKTTVYNSLNVMVEAGFVRVVNIEENQARYDIHATGHGHFKCNSCGQITDFEVDYTRYPTDSLNGFQIDEQNLYLKGVCPGCLTRTD